MLKSFQAYCGKCKTTVTALPLLNDDDLKQALDSGGDVRVMHTASDGDHIWSLTKQDKENLRKHNDQTR